MERKAKRKGPATLKHKAAMKRRTQLNRLQKLKESRAETALKEPADLDEKEKMKEVTETTVSAVKALLMATKDERTKRGKYIKYSLQLREEIAQYAVKHGTTVTRSFRVSLLKMMNDTFFSQVIWRRLTFTRKNWVKSWRRVQ